MKKLFVLAVMAMCFHYMASAADSRSWSATSPQESLYDNAFAMDDMHLLSYATYQALVDALNNVPNGSVMYIKYSKDKDVKDPENDEFLADFITSVLLKKGYRVIKTPASNQGEYYEVYLMTYYESDSRVSGSTCEGGHDVAKVEIIKKSTNEIVGSVKRKEQCCCGRQYDETTSSFNYVRFQEEYDAEW